MKWFLCIYRHHYDQNPLRKLRGRAAGQIIEPPEFLLDELIRFFDDHIWTPPIGPRRQSRWYHWSRSIQRRRNAIHAFTDRDLGTHDDFLKAVCDYWGFLLYHAFGNDFGDSPIPEELGSTLWTRLDEARGETAKVDRGRAVWK